MSVPSKFKILNFICENLIYYYLSTDLIYKNVHVGWFGGIQVEMAEDRISEARKFSVPSDVIKSLDSKAVQLLPKRTTQKELKTKLNELIQKLQKFLKHFWP